MKTPFHTSTRLCLLDLALASARLSESHRRWSYSRVTCAFLLLMLIPTGRAFAVGWVARHNLTPAQYQDEFNTWSGQGLRLESVSAYTSGNETRFAALWDDQPGPGQAASHGISTADLVVQDTTLQAQGFRPAWTSIYLDGSTLRHAVVWEGSSEQRLLRPSRTYGQLQQDKSALESSGWHLHHLSCASLAGVDLYDAVWVKSTFSALQHWEVHMSAAEYQAAFNLWSGKGYRLISVFACSVGGEVQYAAIWRKIASEEWWSFNGLSSANYQTATENAYYQGYRPAFVTGFNVGGSPRFNALWVRNGGWSTETLGMISQGIQKYCSDYQTPGVSLAIMRHGRLVYAAGFGYADKENNEIAGPLHRFRIASISKSLTSTAILKLIEKGNTFHLDDKVFGAGAVLGTQYGSGSYSAREKAITVRNLLTHTTGWTQDGPLWDNSYGVNHKAIMDWALDHNEPTYPPGSHYQYMNLDFHTLGRIIEKYSGMTYDAYVKSAVLAPCGITQMELGDQIRELRKPREVVYYDVDGNDPYIDINPKRMDANGGWIATSIDLLQFLRRVDDEAYPSDILSQTSRDEMRDTTLSGAGYGLGWFTAPGPSEGHNGCMTGTSSFLVHRTASGTSYAVLANKRTGCSWELKAAVDQIVQQLEAKNDWPDYDLFPVPSSNYLSWIGKIFALPSSTGGLDLGVIEKLAPYADPDHDGLPNLAEAYFGTDPSKPNRGPFIRASLDGEDVVFRWSRSTQDVGVDAEPLFSSDMKQWTSNARVAVKVIAPPRLGSDVETVEIRLVRPSRTALFMKLSFTSR